MRRVSMPAQVIRRRALDWAPLIRTDVSTYPKTDHNSRAAHKLSRPPLNRLTFGSDEGTG